MKTKGKRKPANPDEWQKHVAKRNRVCGKEYRNSTGKIVEAKVFKVRATKQS